MLKHLESWWFTHGTWIMAALHFFIPSVNAWMDGHPKSMMTAIAAIVLARLFQGQAPAKA